MSDTREILVQTAAELFLGQGYGAVGTAQLCEAAGVNKGTFYHFFPSKAELLVAAIDHYANEFRTGFDTIVSSRRAPTEKLAAVFDLPAKSNRAWRRAHGFSQGCLVGNMTLERASADAAVKEALRRAMRSWRAALAPMIDELIEADEIPPIDAKRGAELVISMIQGGLVMAKMTNDPSRITAMSSAALGALRAG